MTKKNQVYLSAFLMYLLAGFAGYLINIGSYWMVLIISILLCGYTLINVFNKEEDLIHQTIVEWTSVCGFLGLETIITLCVCVFNVKYIGFFKYFNYGVQILGLLFVAFSLIKYVLLNTETYSFIKSKFKKEAKPEIVIEEEKENKVAVEVQETIAKEETKEEFNMDIDVSDVEVVNEAEIEDSSVKTIEFKEEEIVTPYMEEEI